MHTHAHTHTSPHTWMTFLESLHLGSAGRTVGVLEVLWLPIRTSACRKQKAFESKSNCDGVMEEDVYRERQADQTDRGQWVGNAWIVSQVIQTPPRQNRGQTLP